MRYASVADVHTAAAERPSPELVLVDDEFARWARGLLEPPEDTLDRLEHSIAARRRMAPAPGAVGHATKHAAERSQRNRAPRAVLALATVLLATQLVGIEVDVRGIRAEAEPLVGMESPSVLDQPDPQDGSPPRASSALASAPQPPPTKRSEAGRATRMDESQRFAWVPVAGASGYHVEFFRGAQRIYTAETAVPHIDVPPVWIVRGREERLSPGTYRWYVWSTDGDRREANATVQAELVVD